MKIETEFEVSDSVFIITPTGIVTADISSIHIAIKGGGTVVSYDLYEPQGYTKWTKKEFNMFRTKEGAAERWLADQGLNVGIK